MRCTWSFRVCIATGTRTRPVTTFHRAGLLPSSQAAPGQRFSDTGIYWRSHLIPRYEGRAGAFGQWRSSPFSRSPSNVWRSQQRRWDAARLACRGGHGSVMPFGFCWGLVQAAYLPLPTAFVVWRAAMQAGDPERNAGATVRRPPAGCACRVRSGSGRTRPRRSSCRWSPRGPSVDGQQGTTRSWNTRAVPAAAATAAGWSGLRTRYLRLRSCSRDRAPPGMTARCSWEPRAAHRRGSRRDRPGGTARPCASPRASTCHWWRADTG
jgi:hypothetical protein